MESPLTLSFAALLVGAATAFAQTSSPAAPEPAKKADEPVRVMRALPINDKPLPDLDKLPRTLPPEGKISYSQCHVPGNVIAYTFDDGPSPEYTPHLLDILKERNIKATFFLIGKSVSTWPDIVKRIVDEGHEIANHTWDHQQLTKLKESRVLQELQSTHDAIVKACGVAPILYRPPYGAASLSQRKMIHEKLGYPTILWDVDPEDWRSPKSIAKVHDQVLKQTRSGSIILCHDIHKQTVDAMPSTLDELKSRGFQFVTVTQLLNLDAQTAKEAAIAAAAAAEAKAKAAVEAPATPEKTEVETEAKPPVETKAVEPAPAPAPSKP
ncbi:MAG: peptidoglycan-N-acetylglucosamine deacetylase [Verrucomicrobiaceae bacterium]|nr:peptidoglycan-N-acetylglucosamine deacetylase [Verrucomicrobiaceae bacterium]